MNIAVDVDEVIARFLEQFMNFQEARYNRRLAPEDCHSYLFRDLFDMTEEEEIKQIMEFYDSPFFKDIKPIPEARETLERLKHQGHSLYVITARQHRIEKETKSWIDTHFPGLFEDVVITNEASFDEDHVKKVDVCKELDAQVIIEDSLSNAIDAANANIRAVLIDKPWNQNEDEDPQGLYRVKSWQEASSILLED
ncbi:MAG: 5' nucleotidase, NT5C type [Candidatus Woesearchaeota archaeon]